MAATKPKLRNWIPGMDSFNLRKEVEFMKTHTGEYCEGVQDFIILQP